MDRKKLRVILEIIGTVLFGTSFLLYAAPFITYGSTTVNVSGFQLLFESDRYWKSSDSGSFNFFVWFVIVLVFFLMFLIIFILDTFTKIKISKKENLTPKKAKIQFTVLILICFIITICNFVANLNVSSMSGVLSKTSARVASGAIFSSIFFAIGMIFYIVYGYFAKFESAIASDNASKESVIEAEEDNLKNDSENKITNKLNETVPSKTIEEQLTELKSLKDKGLITEEDYNKKKNQLLGL